MALKAISQEGPVPYFAYWWANKGIRATDDGVWIDAYFAEYVLDKLKKREGESETFDGILNTVGADAKCTWLWSTLQEVFSKLSSLQGLYQIILCGPTDYSFLAEFDKEKVSTLTIFDTPEIFFQESDRKEWIQLLMATLINPSDYKRLTAVDAGKIDVDSISIIRLV